MDYLTAIATLTLAVTGYGENDYVLFYGNLGSGAIDYDTALGIRFEVYEESSIVFVYDTQTPGTYDFGAKAYDEPGNASTATENGPMYIDCEPRAPEPMTLGTYDAVGNTLVLALN